MRFKNCLGIIWSVSTLERSRGAAIDVSVLKAPSGCDLLVDFPGANIDEVAGYGGCGGHLWRYEMGAAAAALTAFEVGFDVEAQRSPGDRMSGFMPGTWSSPVHASRIRLQ